MISICSFALNKGGTRSILLLIFTSLQRTLSERRGHWQKPCVISAWLFLLLWCVSPGHFHPLSSAPSAPGTGWASHCWWLSPQGWDKPGPEALLTAWLQCNNCKCLYPFGTVVFYRSSSVETYGENCLSDHKVISREPASPHDSHVSPVVLLGRDFWWYSTWEPICFNEMDTRGEEGTEEASNLSTFACNGGKGELSLWWVSGWFRRKILHTRDILCFVSNLFSVLAYT